MCCLDCFCCVCCCISCVVACFVDRVVGCLFLGLLNIVLVGAC